MLNTGGSVNKIHGNTIHVSNDDVVYHLHFCKQENETPLLFGILARCTVSRAFVLPTCGSSELLACESEQRHVVILVRTQRLSPLDKHNMW